MEFSFSTALVGSVIALGLITLSFVYLFVTVRGMPELAWWAAGYAAGAACRIAN